MRKAFLVAAIMLQCLAGDARSQGVNSPEALAAAQELSAIMSVETINQLSRAMTAQTWPKIQGELSSKLDPATLTDLRKQFEDLLSRFLQDAMKEAPAIYARHFTAAELKEITGFYRTPTGKKSLATMPQVTAETVQALMPRMQSFQNDISRFVQQALQKQNAPR
jgi:hypothetical protein